MQIVSDMTGTSVLLADAANISFSQICNLSCDLASCSLDLEQEHFWSL